MPRYNRKSKGDIAWYMPCYKKVVAYSTVATRDLIAELSKEGLTIRQVYDRITYDTQAKGLLAMYIKKGYGDVIAKDWFK